MNSKRWHAAALRGREACGIVQSLSEEILPPHRKTGNLQIGHRDTGHAERQKINHTFRHFFERNVQLAEVERGRANLSHVDMDKQPSPSNSSSSESRGQMGIGMQRPPGHRRVARSVIGQDADVNGERAKARNPEDSTSLSWKSQVS